jgi:hypothetical protein
MAAMATPSFEREGVVERKRTEVFFGLDVIGNTPCCYAAHCRPRKHPVSTVIVDMNKR